MTLFCNICPLWFWLVDSVNLFLFSRHNNKDNHHPHDLQAKRYCGTEDDWERNYDSRTTWEECCNYTIKCRGMFNFCDVGLSEVLFLFCLLWLFFFHVNCDTFEQGEKTLQAVPGAKPAIITASRPITKMIVTQPKGIGSGMQPTTTTKIIPTKIVYGQQGKTQVIKQCEREEGWGVLIWDYYHFIS